MAATNSVGAGPDSAPSSAVTPNASPQFVQRVSRAQRHRVDACSSRRPRRSRPATGWSSWRACGASARRRSRASPTPPATRTPRSTSVKASDDTELSVWTAPITAGGGTQAGHHHHRDGQRRHRRRPRSSTPGSRAAAGAAAVDQLKTATGTATARRVRHLGPDPGPDRRQRPGRRLLRRLGLQPHAVRRSELHRARQRLADATTWSSWPRTRCRCAATRRRPASRPARTRRGRWPPSSSRAATVSPPALSVSPDEPGLQRRRRAASSPAAKTLTVSNAGGGTMNWTASESASWLSLSPTSGTNDGTITATPSITGLAAGTYTTDVTVTATRRRRLAEDDPRDLHGRSAHAADARRCRRRACPSAATQGGSSPAAKTLVGEQHRRRLDGLDGLGRRGLAERVARRAGRTRARSR